MCVCVIIWELPDFKPIHRISILQEICDYSIMKVALYKDYIVCYSFEYMQVWKSSLDNLENQLQFDLQYSLKGICWNHICIHNDIIYGNIMSDEVGYWNLETGEMISKNSDIMY